jgi:hypothetical protein
MATVAADPRIGQDALGTVRAGLHWTDLFAFWGAPRIQNELLKPGIDVGQTSVAKYMARRRGGPSQGWRTFLCNHADGIVSMDLFVVPTLSFRPLYGFLVLRHRRRRIMWLGIAARPTAEWIMQQANGGLRLGGCAGLYRARSRLRLWRGLHPAASRDGHSRPTNGTAIAMAERLR